MDAHAMAAVRGIDSLVVHAAPLAHPACRRCCAVPIAQPPRLPVPRCLCPCLCPLPTTNLHLQTLLDASGARPSPLLSPPIHAFLDPLVHLPFAAGNLDLFPFLSLVPAVTASRKHQMAPIWPIDGRVL